MADIDKNPATLLAEQAALDPPQRRDVAVAVALMSASTLASTASPDRTAARCPRLRSSAWLSSSQ